jgi:hypothetical protein
MTGGLIAEFDEAEALTRAVRAALAAGWTRFEAYAPHPLPDAEAAMGLRAGRVGWSALAAGALAGLSALALAWYLSGVAYPLDVGGRPPVAWPAYLPAAYIVAVLWAALGAMFAMLWFNGLPRLHHPVFEVPGFDRASEDRFFLLLSAEDPLYALHGAEALLQAQSPRRIEALA